MRAAQLILKDRWNDLDLRIDWGFDESNAILSERDRKHPSFEAATDLF